MGTICSIYSLLEFMMGAPVDVRRFKQCSAAECAKQVYAVTKQLTDGGKLHPLDSAGRSKVELLFSTEIDSADDSRLNTRAFLSHLEEVDKIAAAVMGSGHESDLAERRARYSRMLASTDDGCFSIPEIEVAERQLRHLSRGAFDHGLATMQIGPASDMVTAMTQMKKHFSNGPLRIYNWGTISRDAFETYVERPAEMASAQADAELRAEKLAHIRSQRAGAAATSKSKGPRRTSLSGSRVGGEDPSAEPDSDEGSEDEAPPAAAGGGGRGKRGRVGSDPARRDDPARKGSASLPARGNFCTFLERGNNGYDPSVDMTKINNVYTYKVPAARAPAHKSVLSVTSGLFRTKDGKSLCFVCALKAAGCKNGGQGSKVVTCAPFAAAQMKSWTAAEKACVDVVRTVLDPKLDSVEKQEKIDSLISKGKVFSGSQ